MHEADSRVDVLRDRLRGSVAWVRRIRTAELVHRGGMRFEAETGTGRRYVFGDDAETNEYSPMETVAAAIGACTAMDVVSILDKKRQRYDSDRIEVRADQRAE
jgi:putative redox protein